MDWGMGEWEDVKRGHHCGTGEDAHFCGVRRVGVWWAIATCSSHCSSLLPLRRTETRPCVQHDMIWCGETSALKIVPTSLACLRSDPTVSAMSESGSRPLFVVSNC